MNRRKFLRTFAIGTLAAPNIFSGCNNENFKPLEEFVSFPQEIPGAEKVEKFSIAGANYCLAHIRQIHHIDYNPHDPIDKILGIHEPTKKELERINSHQKSIYEILDFLKQNRITNSVYLEGIDSVMLERIKKINMVPEDENLTRDLEDLEQKVKQRIIWEVPKGYTPEKLIQEYQQELSELKKRIEEHDKKYKYYYGGGLRLVLEEKIEPRFEDLSLNNKSFEEFKRTKKLGYAILDEREDAILRSIVKNGDKLAVVEFGGIHAWGGRESCGKSYSLVGRKSYKDNIAEWNKECPDKKFCLIEIVPRGYE